VQGTRTHGRHHSRYLGVHGLTKIKPRGSGREHAVTAPAEKMVVALDFALRRWVVDGQGTCQGIS
jgi:hypothetical protein